MKISTHAHTKKEEEEEEEEEGKDKEKKKRKRKTDTCWCKGTKKKENIRGKKKILGHVILKSIISNKQ